MRERGLARPQRVLRLGPRVQLLWRETVGVPGPALENPPAHERTDEISRQSKATSGVSAVAANRYLSRPGRSPTAGFYFGLAMSEESCSVSYLLRSAAIPSLSGGPSAARIAASSSK
jgi:hypothetical protein